MSLRILVTGTNSGFGHLTTIALARRGHHVFAGMRDPTGRNRPAADAFRRLREAEGVVINVVELDVGSDASVTAAVASVLGLAGHLDVVVNNAGYATVGAAETVTSDQLLQEINVNVVGPHRVARAVLPSMRARRQGLLLQSSSSLGRMVVPFMGATSASKSALEALFDAYRYELKATGVESVFLQAGAFPTDAHKRTVVGADQERAKGYGSLEHGLEHVIGQMAREMTNAAPPLDPQEVADAIVEIVELPEGMRPKRFVIDRVNGQGTEAINDLHQVVQGVLLRSMGLGTLAD